MLEKRLIDLKDVVTFMNNEVFHDHISQTAVGNGIACPLQQLFGLVQIQF